MIIIRLGAVLIILFLQVLFSLKVSFGQAVSEQIKSICIDPGHGGNDPGALGATSKEKNITLKLALKLGELIKSHYPDIKIVYTRKTDVAVDLRQRTKMANTNKVDLFISIHTNSAKDKRACGMETFVLGVDKNKSQHNLNVAMRENAVIKYEKDYSVNYAGFSPDKPESYIMFQMMQSMHLGKSLELAAAINNELVKNTGKNDRGVRQSFFWVLSDAAMPAVLIEVGFISNPTEEKYINSADGQNKIVNSIFKGFEKYKEHTEKVTSALVHKTEKPEEVTEEVVKFDEEQVKPAENFFYAIQVASATSKIKNCSKLYEGEKVSELQDGGRYRYYIKQNDDFETAKETMQKIKRKVKDCFIIAVHDGKIIPLTEARKLEKK